MIDSHHHLWSYSAEDYPWIPPGSALAADHLLPELEVMVERCGLEGTVAVQARQSLEESEFLLDLAKRTPRILGVVGWVPLLGEDVVKPLERFAADPRFRGVRHVLQDEPDEWFRAAGFHRGLAELPGFGLRYDVLIYQRQLGVALEMVDRHPELGFVIDHLAKPEARNGRVERAWREGMRELAARDQVLGVKFSGLWTEFPDDETADEETVSSYFEELWEIFGPRRVMYGSDWPVCQLRASPEAWAERARDLAARLSEAERRDFLAENARRIYGLA